MDLTIGQRVRGGGFADVYEGTDNLGRRVAIKIIRGSAGQYSSALDHARALARARHPNVVEIYSLERVQDPESSTEVDAIVMEFLEGETLGARFNRSQLSLHEVTVLGRGLLAGLAHIHEQGLAHGDLHEENVILVGPQLKIIDILYHDTLALLSTTSQQVRYRRDLLNLRSLLYEALLKSELDPADATDFNAALTSELDIAMIRNAFETVINPSRKYDTALQIEHALQRLRDDGFVEGDQYAHALAQETRNDVGYPLLLRLISEGGVSHKHRPFLRLLWDRLDSTQKADVGQQLGAVLDREVPKGKWSSPVYLLGAFAAEGWRSLPTTSRLRFESVVVNDILAGSHDIYGTNIGTPGALGTHSNTFWSYFLDRDRLIENICARLSTNWNAQNYIGKYMMGLLPLIADTVERRARLVSALIQAVKNDARLVLASLNRLPLDWQQEISAGTQTGSD